VQSAYIDANAAGSTAMAQVAAAPTTNVSGTYNMYFEYCQPKTGNPDGVFQTHHGLVGNAGYWNVQLEYVSFRCLVAQADDLAVSPTTLSPSLPLLLTGLHYLTIDWVSVDLPTLMEPRSFRLPTRSPNLPPSPRCYETDKSEMEFPNSARSLVSDIVSRKQASRYVTDAKPTDPSSSPVLLPLHLILLSK